jgi:hypothetical protein
MLLTKFIRPDIRGVIGHKGTLYEQRMNGMDSHSSPLPWEQLRRTAGGIPWPALHAFAEAAETDPGVVHRLFDVFDRAYEDAVEQDTYADLYVPAIFALAAPRLDDEKRREIGSWVVEKMTRAARDDADLTLEVLETTAGTMGPVILPAVLDAIAREPDMSGAWFHLWGLTTLAARSDDADLRDRVGQACVELLEKADRGEITAGYAMNAAWTLGSLQRAEYADLLHRLTEKAEEDFCRADYEGALKLLLGRLEEPLPPEPWEEPVEKWLTAQWSTTAKWFAERAAEEEEEEVEDPDEHRARLLASDFFASPVAATLPPELRTNALFLVQRLVYHSLRDLDIPVGDWDESALRELMLIILPRELPADRELLVRITPVTEAFLYWLGSQGLLENADALAAMVRGLNEQIVAAGLDRKNWSVPKTIAMEAVEAGLDLTDPQVRRALEERQLHEFVGSLPTAPAPEPPAREEAPAEEPPAREEPPHREQPPIPIVEHAKVARNAPCPCGSGKKYKKCHGRPGARQPLNS